MKLPDVDLTYFVTQASVMVALMSFAAILFIKRRQAPLPYTIAAMVFLVLVLFNVLLIGYQMWLCSRWVYLEWSDYCNIDGLRCGIHPSKWMYWGDEMPRTVSRYVYGISFAILSFCIVMRRRATKREPDRDEAA